MDWIVLLLLGGFIGWLASVFMNTDASQGLVLNIMIGIAGAALGRWLFGDVLNIGGAVAAGSFSVVGIFWGVLGAALLIVVLRGLRLLR